MVSRKQKKERKAAQRSKRIAQVKHRQKHPQQPSRFTNRYATPDLLVAAGPLVPAVWSLPKVLEQRLLSKGLPVPTPVFGQLLLDTGASRTCISETAAAELGLQSLRLQDSYGASGPYQAPVYRVRLTIGVKGPHAVTEMHWETEAQEVRKLEESVSRMGLTIGVNVVRLIGLLGRDILRHTKVNYNGLTGHFEIYFDLASLNKSSTLQTAS